MCLPYGLAHMAPQYGPPSLHHVWPSLCPARLVELGIQYGWPLQDRVFRKASLSLLPREDPDTLCPHEEQLGNTVVEG